MALLQQIPPASTSDRVATLTETALGLHRAAQIAEAASLRPPLPPAPAPAAPTATPPAAPRPLTGPAEVLTTANMIVGTRAVRLAHVEGRGEPHARGIAAFIASRGGSVTCEPVAAAAAMRCTTADGIDLAEAALFNGGARAAPNAPEAYRAVEAAAREARRGIWASGNQ
jgi:hypothetical protein